MRRLFTLALALGMMPMAFSQEETPGIKLINFHRGVYAGGARLYIFWSSQGIPRDPGTILIELSRDAGAAWTKVASGLPNTGKYLWTLPRDEGDRYRLRVTYNGKDGTNVSALSAESFGIDSEAPVVIPYCKQVGEKMAFVTDGVVPLKFQIPAETGPAPVALLEVWATTDRGATWKNVAKGKPGDEILSVPVAAEETGIILLAQDAAGNRDRDRLEGRLPQIRILWSEGDPPPPDSFAGLKAGGTYQGKTPVLLRWNPPEGYVGGPARVEILVEGAETWDLLVEDLPPEGTFKAEIPAVNSAVTEIRIVVNPKSDEEKPWIKTIGPFRIETPAPKARITGVDEEKEEEEEEKP